MEITLSIDEFGVNIQGQGEKMLGLLTSLVNIKFIAMSTVAMVMNK